MKKLPLRIGSAAEAPLIIAGKSNYSNLSSIITNWRQQAVAVADATLSEDLL